MGKRGLIKYQLTGSYTRQGYHSFVPELVKKVARIWVLRSPVGIAQSGFIKNLGEDLSGIGYEVEFWLSALEPGGAEGVYFPQLNAAVVSGSLLDRINGLEKRVKVIELSTVWERSSDSDASDQELASWEAWLLHHKRLVEDRIENALYLEEYNKREERAVLNQVHLQSLIEELQEALFSRPLEIKHYYATSLTLDGLIDYVQEISGNCRKRYILQGPPDCGQRQVFEQVAWQAQQLKLEVEYYHWALDPQRICLLLIPALKSAVVDKTHLDIKPQPGDAIIDMGQLLSSRGASSSELYPRMDTLLLQVQADLDEINRAWHELRKRQISFVDIFHLERQREKMEREIEKY